MIKKSLFNYNTLNIPEGITNNEDMLMNIRLATRLESIYCNPKLGYYLYFDRGGSASKKRIPKRNWELLYNEYLSMKAEYGSIMYVCIANSIYERYITKDLTLIECCRFIKHVKVNISIPLYIWFIKLFFSRPNKFTKVLLRVAYGLHRHL